MPTEEVLDVPTNLGGGMSMLGKTVRVFWPVDSSWYTGTVRQYDAQTGEHLLEYADGDKEWVRIGESNLQPMNNNNNGGGGGSTSATVSTATVNVVPMNNNNNNNSNNNHHHPTATSSSRHTPPTVAAETPPPLEDHTPPPAPSSAAPTATKVDPVAPTPGVGYPNAAAAYPPHNPYAAAAYPPHHAPPPHYGMMPYPYGAAHLSGYYGAAAAAVAVPKDDHGGGKEKRKTGPKAWSKTEDELLLSIVHSMQWPMKWTVVAQSLPDRTGKQCRERYVNHLNPRLKVSDWTVPEDATIFYLYDKIGSHWAKMSKIIPGRTDNGIKNRFHNIRRQYEREDEHRLRVGHDVQDYAAEIRLERLRTLPTGWLGKTSTLWDLQAAQAVLAAQSVTDSGSSNNRNADRFGPFRQAEPGQQCVRCGLVLPSVQTGQEYCTRTHWCVACTRVPPHACGNFLREILNLRRCGPDEMRDVIESWEEQQPGFRAKHEQASSTSRADDNQENASNNNIEEGPISMDEGKTCDL